MQILIQGGRVIDPASGTDTVAEASMTPDDATCTGATPLNVIRLLVEAKEFEGVTLKFVPVDSDGQEIEPRGNRPPPRRKSGPPKQGKYMAGKRGRPGNVRHQGKRKG